MTDIKLSFNWSHTFSTPYYPQLQYIFQEKSFLYVMLSANDEKVFFANECQSIRMNGIYNNSSASMKNHRKKKLTF